MTGLDPVVAAAFITGFGSLVVALISAFVAKAKIEAADRDTAQKLAQAKEDSQANLLATERDTTQKLAQAAQESQAKIAASERETERKLAQAAEQSKANLDQAAVRLRREFQMEFAAETAAKALLEDHRFKQRTFATIKRHLRGFEDDELRKLLVCAGAVCFVSKTGEELWGLLDLNRDKLGRLDLEDPGAMLGDEFVIMEQMKGVLVSNPNLVGHLLGRPYLKLPPGVIVAAPPTKKLPGFDLGEYVFRYPLANPAVTLANPFDAIGDAASPAGSLDEISMSVAPSILPGGGKS